ncbi:MAG: VCBS repeat-containing protein [Bacteroidetes bacterium]|nr:VCBS repeat-containing protein [Bacteroidota bacterium]
MQQLRLLLIFLFVSCALACNTKHTRFEKISSDQSGISFKNNIVENDSINPLSVVNIYNGGGVGIGDFNNDGLMDIYLTGNMVPSKLYLNKGNFKFEDVTEIAGVEGLGRWARGVSVVDINNDGLMDLYVCNTIYKDSLKRQNILYINQGNDKNGVPHFKNMAAEYGLDIHVQSTMGYFFDYDNDGDLDMYLAVNEASNGYGSSVFVRRNDQTVAPNRGRLYRNDWDAKLGHAVFHDVSDQAGIIFDGYGHAATICDINGDGWKDIYVSDDFLSSNLLYINNHDGTFTNRAKEYFKHTSFNSMGQDVVDINNDGLPDVVELDMNPEDNYRKKMMSGSLSTNTYQNFDLYGYQYQYVRNTLQLNQGPSIKENDSIGIPAFSDISFMSGMSQTDWSWTPLITDFDNDGYRDLIITNGFPRDVSDHDFVAYRQKANSYASPMQMLEQIPQIKLHNYAFKNKGDLTFSDETTDWGLSIPTFSNGAAYADLDNDGAMDMVINNINDEAFVYRNTSRDNDTTSHFLQVKFKGDKQNINGLGASANIYYDHGKQQVYDNNPYRGYLSSMAAMAHFGLGKISEIDSVVIGWTNGKKQTIKNVKANQVLAVNINDAKDDNIINHPAIAANTLFKEITTASGITYRHNDFDLIDFNIQTLLPHKLSDYCPAIAVADIDGNGIDDFVVGGNATNHAKLFFQQPNGQFLQKDLLPKTVNEPVNYKDEGILLFDANGDGSPDLYIASGGYKTATDTSGYQDRLYINDGKGNFKADSFALPVNYTSKLCVRAMDFNNDGKMDLFVSGRVQPAKYPMPVNSFIFRNDSENGHVKFTDVTHEVAPDLEKIGLVCDALFTDFDDDGQTDLIIIGEWMPVTFLKNINGKFKNVTASSGIAGKTGWWNAIAAGDFRHTGRTDYIVGNVGLNTFYKATDQNPVYITAKEFDNNGRYIAIPSVFLSDEHGVKKEFPAQGRDDLAKQMPGIKKRFATYKPFAVATMDEIITPEQRKGALRLQANTLQSCYLRNEGGGKFTMIPLPAEAQMSVLDAMLVDDFDDDGNLDVLINSNDFGTDVSTGRYDAMNGLLMKGDGNGNFTPLSILQSGIYIPGDGKALVKLQGSTGNYLVAASQNRGPLKLYTLNKKPSLVKLNPDDIRAVINFKNGKIQKEEIYNGSSFLSQSGKFLSIGKDAVSAEITNSRGVKRKISFTD